MSKKGQDNQEGITFQNKVALLYMLDNYRYGNFLKIKFEGDDYNDFTLFFKNSNNNSSFFWEFEAKKRDKSLTLFGVKNIIAKEAEKGINRYSDNDQFYIVAPQFQNQCKEQIKQFKKHSWVFKKDGFKNFDQLKKMYQQFNEESPILYWSKEEIILLLKTEIVELNKEIINKKTQERFYYEQSFFYNEENADNIIARLFKDITEASSKGYEFTKYEIEQTITKFCNAETNKSESYNLNQDLKGAIDNIESKLNTESTFATLNDDKYITPISKRVQAIFYITDKLKQKSFSFKKIKWFFDKILIKESYMLSSFSLLETYIEKNNLDLKDKTSVLGFLFKIYEYEKNSSSIYKRMFETSYRSSIFKIFLKFSKNKEFIQNKELKPKLIKFLDKHVPDWQATYLMDDTYGYYRYQYLPQIIKNLFSYTKEGIDFIIKKYNFTNEIESPYLKTNQYHWYSPYNYIKDFINKDFEKNFLIVVKGIAGQFTDLYKKSYGYNYEGYEITGGGPCYRNGQASLKTFSWELILSGCIKQFYTNTKNWEFLKSIIDVPCNKENPVFVKRSFIPFLLMQLETANKTNPEENEFYQVLQKILKIKEGFPRTKEIAINVLSTNFTKILDVYLNLIIKQIIYKYSNTGVVYDIVLIQLLLSFIEHGKLYFKSILKKTLLNKNFKSTYLYRQSLGILKRKIENQHIKDFFNEIKNNLDMSENTDLLYEDVVSNLSSIDALFNGSSKKELDSLASIIAKAIANNNFELIKKVLPLIKNNLSTLYKRATISKSNYLKNVIAQLVPKAITDDMQLAEAMIEQCIKDTNLCDESTQLHESIIKHPQMVAINTMRTYLCYFSINSYIIYYNTRLNDQTLNTQNCKKLEKAFNWVKTLIDLDGTLADKIPDFPKPNYYLRFFAITPLISLSYYHTRKKLNQFKKGFGDKIKQFAFTILEKTDQEIKENNPNPKPKGMLDAIGRLFDVVRDLNEDEAKKVLSFIQKHDVEEFDHLFIYYALFREEHLLDKGTFESSDFKDLLKRICEWQANKSDKHNALREHILFTIYHSMKLDDQNKNQATYMFNLDEDFFEKIKPYWKLFFTNPTQKIESYIIMSFGIILKHNQNYYSKYKKYFFDFIKKIINKKPEFDNDYYALLNIDMVLPAIVKYAPNDLIELLFLFLNKGNSKTGDMPFGYQVVEMLKPEIEKQQKHISKENINKAKAELNKYNINLKPNN